MREKTARKLLGANVPLFWDWVGLSWPGSLLEVLGGQPPPTQSQARTVRWARSRRQGTSAPRTCPRLGSCCAGLLRGPGDFVG